MTRTTKYREHTVSITSRTIHDAVHGDYKLHSFSVYSSCMDCVGTGSSRSRTVAKELAHARIDFLINQAQKAEKRKRNGIS